MSLAAARDPVQTPRPRFPRKPNVGGAPEDQTHSLDGNASRSPAVVLGTLPREGTPDALESDQDAHAVHWIPNAGLFLGPPRSNSP